jgi:hypothetical protein
MQAVLGARNYKILAIRKGLRSMETVEGARNEANLAFCKGMYSVGTFVRTRVCQTFVVNSSVRNYFVKIARCRYC